MEERKLSLLEMMLKQSTARGELPQTGDFFNLFEWTDDDCGKVINTIVRFTSSMFYVRKEVLCVLKNFMEIYAKELESGELLEKQFILMGSPGTGKSCILVLLCFYLSIKQQIPVLWHRQVLGGPFGPFTYLFYQGKYYQWEDREGKLYSKLRDILVNSSSNTRTWWLVLDGLNQHDLIAKNWFTMFTLLATSGQFSPKSESAQYMECCLVPYWKTEDLQVFGSNHMGMDVSEVDSRIYGSGGSLREFLNNNAKKIVEFARNEIKTSEDAENLLTMTGVGSNNQIDRICMRDRNNVEHYVRLSQWTSVVTSKFMLSLLSSMMKPNFFEKLMGIAKGMKDDRLEGVAFEQYFHALVRHHRSLCLQYCKYDNVDRRTVKNYEEIMKTEVGSIDIEKLDVVQCLGQNRLDCVEVMKNWAADPSTMDYRIPETSLCETIDAVAKWTFPDELVRYCFLQVTKATTHKCNQDVLWELAQPCVNKKLEVCYMVLLLDEKNIVNFRRDPVVLTKEEIVKNIPLYVAHFDVLQYE